MNRKYKDSQGKAIQWAKSRLGRHYRRRVAFRALMISCMSGMTCAAGISQYNAIRALHAFTEQQSVATCAALAETLIQTYQAVDVAIKKAIEITPV